MDGSIDVALLPQEVARIFRRRAKSAGLENAGTISGHSARIGSANDLAEYGATGTQIQLAGGWKTDRMVTYYTRRSQAGINAMGALRNSGTATFQEVEAIVSDEVGKAPDRRVRASQD